MKTKSLAIILILCTFFAAFSANAETSLYIDEETDVQFSIPENWHQEAFSEDRELLNVKLVSDYDETSMIAFGGIDLWEQLSPEEKNGLNRSDFNHQSINIDDLFEEDTEGIEEVYYNQIPYYKVELSNTTSVVGIDLTMEMVCLAHLENGWGYYFYFFCEENNSNAYQDFETLLYSVKYPTHNATTVSPPETTEEQPQEETTDPAPDTNQSDKIPPIAIVIVIATVGALIALFIYYAYKNNREAPKEICNDENKTLNFCPGCGFELPKDSIFCHKCGEKINKGDPNHE